MAGISQWSFNKSKTIFCVQLLVAIHIFHRFEINFVKLELPRLRNAKLHQLRSHSLFSGFRKKIHFLKFAYMSIKISKWGNPRSAQYRAVAFHYKIGRTGLL